MAPKRKAPNVDDPLSEETPQRRLWAAYLRAGFTRATFCRAVGVRYHTLDAWDTGRSTPDLENFAKAAQLVGYTVDELLFGHGGMVAAAAESDTALSVEGVRTVLDQMRATPAQASALAAHRQSIEGMYARFTARYVRTFVAAYAAELESGGGEASALARAVAEAQHAQALADAHARGIRAVPAERIKNLATRVASQLGVEGQRAPQPAAKRPRKSVKRASTRTKSDR